ncbi:MAG: hypothetical protein OXH57_06690 [Ekhidna sp.]|nr:hypothetical protein [Ekhidna sp.]
MCSNITFQREAAAGGTAGTKVDITCLKGGLYPVQIVGRATVEVCEAVGRSLKD